MTSTTDLARKLTPPSLPRPPIAAAGSEGCGAAVLLVVGLFLVGSGYLLISISGVNISGIIALVGGLGFIGYLLVAVIATFIIRQRMRPSWERAMEIWDKLYYCARNDVVFLPGMPPEYAVPPYQMKRLLYPPQT